MKDSLFRALPPLRRAVRQFADAHHTPVDVRARLVVSVSALAEPAFLAGRSVALRAAVEPGADARPHLAMTLRYPHALGARTLTELPLPVTRTTGREATWHVPLTTADPDRPRPAAAAPAERHRAGDAESLLLADIGDTKDELLAVLARADEVDAEHRRLKHELAETNSGVLALYVQLEERDEKLRAAHGQVLRELEDALRPTPIETEGLELAVHYAPAGEYAPTGGDLYDWFVMPDGSLHITIVDALGHGVRSTRGALTITHAVRTLALEGHPLASIVARTDEVLVPFDPELMATVQLIRVDLATGALRVANGSHPPPLLLRADRTAEFLQCGGRGIGYPFPGSERILRTHLARGDLLICYTDGLTESRRDPREGEIRLISAARRHLHRPTSTIPGAIAKDMHTVVLHADDTLALAVRRPEQGPHRAP
ncbi:PP2C family protein-serine/threonine phosphatase [Streptomyces sp. 184]|uniref:PP2C family protein-serine/threonine phosphatase n=1 Tax=Streptomyces sp. 184 TaxID=1827526 RepID=UPI003891B9A9